MAGFLILFDVDGTLVSVNLAGKRALEIAFRRVFEVDSFGTRTAGVQYAGRTDPRIIADLAAALGIAEQSLGASMERLLETYYEELDREMARDDPDRKVLPGVLPLLEVLERQEDVLLGLLTGNLERGARTKLEPFGLNRYFPEGGFSSDHPDRAEIARIAVEKFSRRNGGVFPPSRVRVVGDTDHDVLCARVNGYRAIAVNSSWVPRERLERSGPDALLDSLEDLPKVIEALGLEPS